MKTELTFEELRAYQSGQLTGPARVRVEKILHENPFYADALAGLEEMARSHRPTPTQLTDLRQALQARIHASASKKRLWHLWMATAIGAILLVLAVAIYLIYFFPKANTRPPKPEPTAAQTPTSWQQPIRAHTGRSNDYIFKPES